MTSTLTRAPRRLLAEARAVTARGEYYNETELGSRDYIRRLEVELAAKNRQIRELQERLSTLAGSPEDTDPEPVGLGPHLAQRDHAALRGPALTSPWPRRHARRLAAARPGHIAALTSTGTATALTDSKVAHRRMRDPQFRQEQLNGLRASHVAPVNSLVDELVDPSGRGWVPYVAPVYGGVDARVLCIQRDPGPKTNSQYGGNGFLCPENDDATAERFANHLDEVGIPISAILAWNAYPWYINRSPRAAELEAGVEPLRRLLSLLPRLQVVMLHGASAQDGWRRLIRRHPGVAAGLEVLPTYHTSSQAFIGPPDVRAARMAALRDAFARAARVLQEPGHNRRSAQLAVASTTQIGRTARSLQVPQVMGR